MFRDRHEAGLRLAETLQSYGNRADVIVLALPRGGVPVGYEIATRLGVPLDLLVVRKLGVPGHEELAMGAIASGGVEIVEPRLLDRLGISERALARVVGRERAELARRERLFRGERPPLEIAGKTVIVVDDGLATGATMVAAVQSLRSRHPARIVVAVPVASRETCDAFRALVDQVICLVTPEPFRAVGIWYDDFSQTSDTEVRELLDRAREQPTRAGVTPSVGTATPR